MDMNTSSIHALPDEHGRDIEAEDFGRIGELAKQFGITLRTLRFYEDKGLISPKRDGAMRLYSRRDKARLKLILLGRKVGFSLREVKQMLDLYEPSGNNVRQLKVTLEKSEKQLARLEKQRDHIDDAIRELTGAIEIVRADLAQRTSESGHQTN
jgi:DNA-binding transcriptional MerR regulator